MYNEFDDILTSVCGERFDPFETAYQSGGNHKFSPRHKREIKKILSGKKPSKTFSVIKTALAAAAGLAIMTGLTFGSVKVIDYYSDVTELRFDHVNCKALSEEMSVQGRQAEKQKLLDDGYGVNYPFFANSNMLINGGSEDGGRLVIVSIPLGADKRMLDFYAYVDNPIMDFAFDTAEKYDNNVKIDYEIENNGKTLTVNFKGQAGGAPFSDSLSFDIENASLDKPPHQIEARH